MVDLVGHAVVVREIDKWQGEGAILQEDRLRKAILGAFAGEEPRLSLNVSAPFRSPPVADERDPNRRQGVTAAPCSRGGSSARTRSAGAWQPLTSEISFEGKVSPLRHGTGKAVPVRFVSTCNRGHLGEFPWRHFAHMAGGDSECKVSELYLEEGAAGDYCNHRPVPGVWRRPQKL